MDAVEFGGGVFRATGGVLGMRAMMIKVVKMYHGNDIVNGMVKKRGDLCSTVPYRELTWPGRNGCLDVGSYIQSIQMMMIMIGGVHQEKVDKTFGYVLKLTLSFHI